MRYLKTQIKIPIEAYEQLKKYPNMSEKIEEIAASFLDKDLDQKKVSGRPTTVAISYDLIKKIKTRKKNTEVKKFIELAIKNWIEGKYDRRKVYGNC